MDNALIGVVGLVFLAVGLGIGLYLRRVGMAGAASSARQQADRELAVAREQIRARDDALADAKRLAAEQVVTLAGEQGRIVALSAEAARARAEAEQAAGLKASLEESEKALQAAQEEGAKAAVKAAEGATRLSELHPLVSEFKGKVETLQGELESLRETAGAATEGLAKVQAELGGVEQRRADTAAELVETREASAKVQADLDTVRKQATSFQADLAKAKADLTAAEQRYVDAAQEVTALRGRGEALQLEVKGLVEERTRLATDLDAERKAADERKADAERTREQVRAEVEKLAGRLLEQQGKVMLDRSKEGLEAMLKPLGEKLRDFEQKVEKTYDTENRDRASLLESLKTLQDTQAKLHKDAEALSKALTRDSRQQGDWGEIVLERVLETAGLAKGREYELQVSHTDEEGGRKRPDALIYLPENRAVVVDAKCSLTAFVEAARAVTEEEREQALDAHLASVRAHVKGLAGKSYNDVLQQRSLDFVVLFVPQEAAFLAALSREPGLYEESFRQGVVLCSPTTLIAALRLIAQLWRTERQNQNARKIAEEAGKLLEKLAGFVEDLDNVGARLGQAQEAFSTARAKLESGRGNVFVRAAAILRLGASARTEKVQTMLLDGASDDGLEEGEEEGGGDTTGTPP